MEILLNINNFNRAVQCIIHSKERKKYKEKDNIELYGYLQNKTGNYENERLFGKMNLLF